MPANCNHLLPVSQRSVCLPVSFLCSSEIKTDKSAAWFSPLEIWESSRKLRFSLLWELPADTLDYVSRHLADWRVDFSFWGQLRQRGLLRRRLRKTVRTGMLGSIFPNN
ncbi:hypothetical protein AB1N83_011760 [Pleurotus pulmonarius]